MSERRRSLEEGLDVSPAEADRLIERAAAGERVPAPHRRAAIGAVLLSSAAILAAWGVAWLVGGRVPWIPAPAVPLRISLARVGTEAIGEWRVGSTEDLMFDADSLRYAPNPPLATTRRAEFRDALVRFAERARRRPGPLTAPLPDSSIPRVRRVGIVSLGATAGTLETVHLAVPSPGPDAEGLWRRERDDRIDDLLDRLERP